MPRVRWSRVPQPRRRLWLPQVTPLSAAHPSPPFAGDRRRRPRLTQARRSREISTAVRGSPKLAAHSSPPSAGKANPPTVAPSSHAAIRSSPKPAAVRRRLTLPSAALPSPPPFAAPSHQAVRCSAWSACGKPAGRR